MVRQSVWLMLFLAAGCTTASTPAPQVAAPPGMAAIVITRSSDLMYVGVPAQVDVNGETVASLAVGGNYAGSVRPGPTIITTSTWSAPGLFTARFNAEAGKSYRFVISPRGEAMAAGMVGGIVGMAVEGNGLFQIAAAQ